MANPASKRLWTDFLDEEDIAFLKRLLLASGSLKDVAAAYGVSYPTVRLRLDRLIAKIQVYDSQEIMDDFERVLRAQFADGKLDAATFRRLLAAYQQQTRPDHEPHSDTPSSAPSIRADQT